MPRKRGRRPGVKSNKKRLTEKQRKLAKALKENPDATLAELADMSGYASPPSVHHALQAMGLREQMLKDQRFDSKVLLDELAEGRKATEIKFFQHNGRVTDSREVKNWAIRQSYLHLTFRLRGDLSRSEESEKPMTPVQVAIFIIGERKRRGLHPTENRPLHTNEI